MDVAGFSGAVLAKRGAVGVRTAAREAGVSPATLSRVENGHTPDMETFERLCAWIGADPRRFLVGPTAEVVAAVQFKKATAVQADTARALGTLVNAVFAMIKDELGDEARP